MLYPLTEHFFVFDTRTKAGTEKLMKEFLSLQDLPEFRKVYLSDYLPAVNNLYREIILSNQAVIKSLIKSISAFQLKYFLRMIPEAVRQFWTEGIQSEEYFMKLCGSGGGGYLLVYSEKELNLLKKRLGQEISGIT
jgi:mevalonate kinase